VNLEAQRISNWPKLAWAAKFRPGTPPIRVYHGPHVEIGNGFCVEAVWAGNFAAGGFDQTDLIFGSGIRCRDNQVVFVSSGTTTDRLWYYQGDPFWYVSNSLPALLATADLSLRDDYHYFPDLRSICNGLDQYTRSIPAVPSDIRVLYFHNLVYDGQGLRETEKPDRAGYFQTFFDYHQFLKTTAEALAYNMKRPGRAHAITPLTGISTGYDACATAVIARYAGCRQAVTIKQSNSYWRGSDSGAYVADRLELACREYNRTSGQYPWEEAVWAVSGRAAILNWTQFDYPEPLCLFFSGCRGDMVWDRSEEEVSSPFMVPSVSDLGFCEFRLLKGIFHCVVPFWGIRHVKEIRAVSRLPEMQPWTLGTDYDRPIPRRIIEEVGGVPRGSFARRKKLTSSDEYFLWPYSAEARRKYRRFLEKKGIYAPSSWVAAILRKIVTLDRLLYLNVTGKYHLWDPALRIRLKLRANKMLFHWGNDELKALYRNGLNRDHHTE